MEFSLFAHMERLNADQPHDVLYEDFIGLCKTANEGGVRTVWTGEHQGMEFTTAPNPFTTLVDVAHHTKSVRLGTGTAVVPFWHPIKLTGEAAMTEMPHYALFIAGAWRSGASDAQRGPGDRKELGQV